MPNHPNRGRGKNPARTPKPEEVRRLREALKLTQAEAGELVFVTWRGWARWEAPEEQEGARRMHPAIWALFRLRAGVLTLQELAREVIC